MSDRPDFDPRFDPSYQRGFAGARSAPDHHTPAVRPADEPVSTPPRPASAPSAATPTAVDEAPEVPPGRNPWALALWIVSSILLVAGIWAQWYATRIFSQSTASGATDYYVIPTVLTQLAPWFVGAGLFGLIGVTFLHAVRWTGPRR